MIQYNQQNNVIKRKGKNTLWLKDIQIAIIIINQNYREWFQNGWILWIIISIILIKFKKI